MAGGGRVAGGREPALPLFPGKLAVRRGPADGRQLRSGPKEARRPPQKALVRGGRGGCHGDSDTGLWPPGHYREEAATACTHGGGGAVNTCLSLLCL